MEKRGATYLPKARTQDLVFQSLDNEVLVYDLKRHKAHCLNQTAYLVFQNCDGKKTVSEIKRSLTEELKESVPDEFVWMALDRLGKARLLEQAPVTSPEVNLARRETLKKLGLATVIALPVVTSILAPPSAQAQSCLPAGSMCSPSSGSIPCCFGMCANASTPCPGPPTAPITNSGSPDRGFEGRKLEINK